MGILKWVPRWLGEIYCQLIVAFAEQPFTFQNTLNILPCATSTVRNALSRLTKAGYLKHLSRGQYQAQPPLRLCFSIASLDALCSLTDPCYAPLIQAASEMLFHKYGRRLVSIVLYGSVARGYAHATSDIDLLVVVEEYPASFADRIKELVDINTALFEPKRKLYEQTGRHASIQFYPLNPEEARHHRPLYLDITIDGLILYDRNNFIQSILNGLRQRLNQIGSQRVQLPSGQHYWILKPTIRLGEVIEI